VLVFTGIVEEVGRVVEKSDLPDAVRLRINGPLVTSDASPGDSIAVNGVCLTVVEVLPGGEFTTDVMAETLNRSTLRDVGERPAVNLERAVTVERRLGGHIVQGHVDGTGRVMSRTRSENWEVVRIAFSPDLARYVVEKGSIAVDGVSLTVAGVDDRRFDVQIIPYTWEHTSLRGLKPNELVNLECDMLGKYVLRALETVRSR